MDNLGALSSINGLNGMGNMSEIYSNLQSDSASAAKASALKQSIEGLNKETTDEELMEVCKSFESYFVEQVYKKMMDTVPTSSLTVDSGDSSTASLVDYFKDEAIKSVAEQTTNQNGGVGLAQTLYEQMKRQLNPDIPSADL